MARDSDVGDGADAEPDQPAAGQGLYGIGVTSDLVGTGIQNLRAYERAGLVMPSRTPGGTRLYSPEDVARLRRIQVLLSQGLNLAGVGQVMDLQDDNRRLRDEITSLTAPPQEADQTQQDEEQDEEQPTKPRRGSRKRPPTAER